jgi:hypothetical protein
MQPRSPFARELLIPIAVGFVSILGLAWIFLTSDLSESLMPPTLEPTEIPFDVSPREIELQTPPPPAIPTLEDTPPTATETSPASYPGPPAETLPSASTLITESQLAPSATTAPDQVQPLPAGKYDDMDPNIAYDRYWVVLKNPGTANAYKGALHVSTSIGSEASFRFTGEQFYIGYQRGRNFGTVTVMIDDQPYSFHEQAFDLIWRSPPLSPGTHFVRVIHKSGASINLDYIQVLD